MEVWIIWAIVGISFILLEFIIPGAVTSFIGISALVTSVGIKYGYLNDLESILYTFIFSTLFLLLIVRTLFLKFFKGDESVQNVDENIDAQGTIVSVEEDIFPYKEGRVHFRGSTWQSRSEETILKNSNAIIVRLDGNTLIVKSIEE